jgi:hypothetical protein
MLIIFSFSHQPERTEADKESGSGRPPTILDDSLRKAVVFTPYSRFKTPLLQIQREAIHRLIDTVLRITVTRGGSLQAMTISSKPAEENSLNENGDPLCLFPLCLWLRPLEHRQEEEHRRPHQI